MWKKLQIKKHFWKTIKPNFTDKIPKDKKITFVEDDKIITAETGLEKILHIDCLCEVGLDSEPIVNAIKNLSQHQSV